MTFQNIQTSILKLETQIVADKNKHSLLETKLDRKGLEDLV